MKAAPEPAKKAKAAVAPKAAKAANAESTGTAAKAASATPESPAKARPVLVRDGFTMPEADFGLIAKLKARALAARRETRKSEVLRAGLHALAKLDDKALVAMLEQLVTVKVGRRKKGH